MTSSPSGSSAASLIHAAVIMIFVLLPIIAIFVITPLNEAFKGLYRRARGYFWEDDEDEKEPAGKDGASEQGGEDGPDSSADEDDLDADFYRE